jgi:antitoxin HicB
MTKEAIKEAMDAQPFRPFTVRMADGRHYNVPKRENIHVFPNGSVLIHEGGEGINFVNPQLIMEIDFNVCFDENALTQNPSYTYTVRLEPAQEGGYIVTVPALPGCHTQGETFDEAITMAQECIEGFLESLVKAGRPIPVEKRDPSQPVVVSLKVNAPPSRNNPDS